MIEKTAIFVTVSMLVLPTNANLNLLYLFWGIALFFMAVSVLLCGLIVLRRIISNRSLEKRRQQRLNFQKYIGAFINHNPTEAFLDKAPICDVHDMTDVFLHYFRTLKGEKLERLQDMVSNSDIEERISNSTCNGIRGARMRSLRTLSYLNSQTSLQIIFGSLSSKDKYVRLTAIRCLVRRKASVFLNEIIQSYIKGFPHDYKLLASILANFGKDITDDLQNLVNATDNEVIRTACLETLIIIRPEQPSLDFGQLMQDSSGMVRAATLSLAATCKIPDVIDPLRIGLEDEEISVKIRAAKVACQIKRADLMPQLYKLTSDSELWVRYWALRAMWATGRSGQNFVSSLAKSHQMAADVALEMQSGYV